MTLNCQCCEKAFDWMPGFAVGRKPKYCPKCSNGRHGSYGVANCAVCGVRFVVASRATKNCKEHRRTKGIERVHQCALLGCTNSFVIKPNGSHHRKRCDIHRKGAAISSEERLMGCRTCGGHIPKDRIDGYCRWDHNPEMLTASEVAVLKRQYGKKAG